MCLLAEGGRFAIMSLSAQLVYSTIADLVRQASQRMQVYASKVYAYTGSRKVTPHCTAVWKAPVVIAH